MTELMANDASDVQEMEAYEELLDDAMHGNQMHFARQDYVEEAWRIVDPVLDNATPVHPYQPGTWGPSEADALAPPDSGWANPRYRQTRDKEAEGGSPRSRGASRPGCLVERSSTVLFLSRQLPTCGALLRWTAEGGCPHAILHAPQLAGFHCRAKPTSDARGPTPSYFTSSINRRDIAVTSFRGLTRSDSASNQFFNPGMTSVLPAIRPR